MKKAAHTGGAYTTLGQLVPKSLYKGVRVIEIVIVEDVLVLVYERLVRHGRLVHLTFLGQPGPPAAVNELVEGKGVFLFVGLRRVLVVGVLLQIVLLGIKRGQTPELQDAPVTGHGGKLAGGHQLPAQPLVVLAVTFRLAPCPAIRLHGDRGLAQPVFGYFLDSAGLTATQKHHAVHVAEDGFSVLVVDGLALGQLLIKKGQTDLPGADHGHQLFKVWHLSRIGRLVPQHPHMMGQAAPVNIVRPFTQEIKHLRKGQGNNEVISGGCVGNREENRRFPIPDAVKLQLVIAHDLPELGDVKGGQPGAAGNQNAFCGFARNELSRTF